MSIMGLQGGVGPVTKEAIFAAKRAMNQNKSLKITLPNLVNDALIDGL